MKRSCVPKASPISHRYAAGDVDGPYAADFFVPDDAFAASGTQILRA